MNISIFGLGYVGCISLGCLAQNGHRLIGVDVVASKTQLINQGKPTIIEKDIDTIIEENWKKGRISATCDSREAVKKTEISIICVGTPSKPQGHLNLNGIFQTARQIGEALKEKEDFHIILIRSTVLPGTNQRVGKIIEESSGKKRNRDFAIVSNPEFMREGSAVKDYYHPPFTLVGTDNAKAAHKVREMYRDIDAPIQETEIEIAELIKYVNNTFHALKISFANEVGNICKKIGLDSHQLMHLFCLDHQLNLSAYYLKPGFAFGGSCLPKDLKALQTMAHDYYLDSPVINSIIKSNENQKKLALQMIMDKGLKKIGIIGLSFKEGTDDLRYSPTVDLVEGLMGKGASIMIYDKNVNISKLTGTNKQYIDQHISHLSELISDNLEEVLHQSELIVIAHKEPGISDIVCRYPDKIFVDLVKVREGTSRENYEGICW